MQVMTIEFARNVLRPRPAPTRASSTRTTPHPVIDLMDDPARASPTWAARCASAPTSAKLEPGSQVARGLRRGGRLRAPPPPLRVQPQVPRAGSRSSGFVCSGTSPDDRLVEFIELDGPPVLGRHPGPPRVQEPPRPPAPAVPGVRRRRRWPAPRAATRTSPTSTSTGCRTPRRRPPRRRRDRRRDGRRAVPPPRRAASSTPGTSSPLAGRHLRGARRLDVRRATSSTTRARCRWCRCTTTAPSCSCASTGRPLDDRPARDPRRQARRGRRAARGHRRPGAGRGGRPAGPGASSSWPSSTTRRASATSTRYVFLGHRPHRGRHRPARAWRRST